MTIIESGLLFWATLSRVVYYEPQCPCPLVCPDKYASLNNGELWQGDHKTLLLTEAARVHAGHVVRSHQLL